MFPDDDPDIVRGLERLLKVHGFRPKLFMTAEAFFASFDTDEAMCLLLDVFEWCFGIEVKRKLMRSGASLSSDLHHGKGQRGHLKNDRGGRLYRLSSQALFGQVAG